MSRAWTLLALICTTPIAAQRPGDLLLVCNKSEGTVSVFDAVCHEEVGKLEVGGSPHEIAVSADGCTAVVTDYSDPAGGPRITVLDVPGSRVLHTVALTQPGAAGAGAARYTRPHGVQFVSPRDVLVTSETTGRLVRVDAVAGRVLSSQPTGQRASHIVASRPGAGVAAVTSPVDGSVALFELDKARAAKIPRTVHVGPGAEGVAIHPEQAEVWVALRDEDALVVVSVETASVVSRMDTGRLPLRVAFTPDGARALVTCTQSGELLIIDAARRAVVGEVSIHGDRSEASSLPLAVVSDPESARAYVTCARGEFVAVVNLADAMLIARIDARAGPDGIAYARPSARGEAAGSRNR